jgi:hypothetical protein
MNVRNSCGLVARAVEEVPVVELHVEHDEQVKVLDVLNLDIEAELVQWCAGNNLLVYVLTWDADALYQHDFADQVQIEAKSGQWTNNSSTNRSTGTWDWWRISTWSWWCQTIPSINLSHIELLNIEACSGIEGSELKVVVIALNGMQNITTQRLIVTDAVQYFPHIVTIAEYEAVEKESDAGFHPMLLLSMIIFKFSFKHTLLGASNLNVRGWI